MKPAIGYFWAIRGPERFYIGTWFTRSEAINHYIRTLFEWPRDGLLTKEDIRRLWRKKKLLGDRAVRVQVREFGR